MSVAHETTEAWIFMGVAGAALLAFAVLFLAALIGILRSPLTGTMKLVWVVFAFCAPFLGSVLWFVLGRRDAAVAAGR
ncbi:PLD nuclease N-terminal domain-containing protein [Amycolatopsis sp.]|uniref:PLD nuclease N-terminal domain-containing protein n=1 Tax=Amycolatopsis sp. TaxID=37632 RepID=UPI002D7F7AED|nr:PLD nuclease N-terminal domain-containing protein [Amycolatopsis sp.]HET6704318.1 PLD nuclease N-terminal domain-containing protein [Amycolatopsis sp.]